MYSRGYVCAGVHLTLGEAIEFGNIVDEVFQSLKEQVPHFGIHIFAVEPRPRLFEKELIASLSGFGRDLKFDRSLLHINIHDIAPLSADSNRNPLVELNSVQLPTREAAGDRTTAKTNCQGGAR